MWALEIADGEIIGIRSIVNPDKLAHLGPVGDAVAILRSSPLNGFGDARLNQQDSTQGDRAVGSGSPRRQAPLWITVQPHISSPPQ